MHATGIGDQTFRGTYNKKGVSADDDDDDDNAARWPYSHDHRRSKTLTLRW